MFLEILLAIALGVASGIFTGLTPGIHINLISAIIVSLSTILLQHITPLPIIIFILSMSVTHTFLDSIPSIYLGAPDADMALAALPGHKMLLEGKGHIAVLLTLIGGLGGLLASILLFPLILIILKPFATVITPLIKYILIGLLFFLLLREKNRFTSFALFLTAGAFGFMLFQLPMKQPLLALLSGLFGISLLLISLFETTSFPKQQIIKKHNVETKQTLLSIILSTIVGFFAAFLPGFGASQAAIYASLFLKNAKADYFLILSGAINTIAMVLSLTTFIVLEKARNGSIIAISTYVTIVTQNQIILLCLIMVVVGCIAVILGIRISHLFQRLLEKISYRSIVITVIIVLCILVIFFDKGLGILVLFTATSFGIFAQKIGVSKHYLLGCLVLPTIFYLL